MKKLLLTLTAFAFLAGMAWAMSFSGFPVGEGTLTLSATAQNLRASMPDREDYPGKDIRAVCFVTGDSCNYLLYDTPSQAEGVGFSAQDGDWIFLYGETQCRQFQAVLGEGGTSATLFYTIFVK